MTLLVAYASKHASTQGIAERIAEKLQQLGKEAEARSVDEVSDLKGYEALVVGSTIYYGSWLKVATEWVHRNQVILAARSGVAVQQRPARHRGEGRRAATQGDS